MVTDIIYKVTPFYEFHKRRLKEQITHDNVSVKRTPNERLLSSNGILNKSNNVSTISYEKMIFFNDDAEASQYAAIVRVTMMYCCIICIHDEYCDDQFWILLMLSIKTV